MATTTISVATPPMSPGLSSSSSAAIRGLHPVFWAIGGLNFSVDDLIPVQPQRPLEEHDVTDSIQLKIDVRTLNAKLGILKDAYNIHVFETAYDAQTGSFPHDVSLSTMDLLDDIQDDVSRVISVGSYQSLYADFMKYVHTYFGFHGGFASLYRQASQFDINGGIFDAASLLELLNNMGSMAAQPPTTTGENGDENGDGDIGLTMIPGTTSLSTIAPLAGVIDVKNASQMILSAVDTNCFSNRDPVHGTTASDWKNAANYGLGDGFVDGDMIFIPKGTSVTLTVNIEEEAYPENRNNIGPQNVAALTAATNYQREFFSCKTTATYTQIQRTLQAPLLLVLENRRPNDNISVGGITGTLLPQERKCCLSWTSSTSVFDFFYVTTENGNTCERVENHADATQTIHFEDVVYGKNYEVSITPYIRDGRGSRNVGFPLAIVMRPPPYLDHLRLISKTINKATLAWSGIYDFLKIYVNQHFWQTLASPDGKFHDDLAVVLTNLLPFRTYTITLEPPSPAISKTLTFSTAPCVSTLTATSDLIQKETADADAGNEQSQQYVYNVDLSGNNNGTSDATTSDPLWPTAPLEECSIVSKLAPAVTLNWKTDTFQYAAVYQNGMYICDVHGTESSKLFLDVLPYHSYVYKLIPYDANHVEYKTMAAMVSVKTQPSIQSLTAKNFVADPSSLSATGLCQRLTWSGAYYQVKIYQSVFVSGLENTTLLTTLTMSDPMTYLVSNNLHPGNTYVYRLVPYNHMGKASPYSSLSVSLTTPAAIVSLESIPESITSSSITLQWRGYYQFADLFSRKTVGSTSSSSSDELVVAGLTSGQNTYTIQSGLEPYTEYTFYLVPRNSEGTLVISGNSIYTTERTKPAILTWAVEYTNLTTASLTWTGKYASVDIYKNNELIETVEMPAAAVDGSAPSTITRLISDCDRRQIYEFDFIPKDDAGNMYNYVPSSSTGATTSPAPLLLPRQPVITNMTFSDITSTSFRVSWEGVYDLADIYRNGVFFKNVSSEQTSEEFLNLSPCATSTFKMIPTDRAGRSYTESSNYSVTTQPAILSIEAAKITATTVTVTWDGAFASADFFQNNTLLKTMEQDEISTIVRGLTPFTSYTFYLIPKDHTGQTYPNIPRLTLTTQQAMLSTSISNVTSNSMVVNWTGSYSTADLYQNSQYVRTVTAAESSASITGLTPSTMYTFYLLPNGVTADMTANYFIAAARTYAQTQ
jgi:hypothetical protein